MKASHSLIEKIAPANNGLLGKVPEELKARVISYLDKVAGGPDAPVPYYENPEKRFTTVETPSFAIRCLIDIHDTDRVEKEKCLVIDYLESSFNQTLGIYDTEENQKKPSIGAMRIHHDDISRMGLSALGVPPKPWPQGIGHLAKFPWAWQPGTSIKEWLQKQCENNVRDGIKSINQFIKTYCGVMNIRSYEQFDDLLHEVVSFLETVRDSESGFMGMGPGVRLGHAMRGHRNLVINNHWRYGIPETQQEKLIDSTLQCQNPNGSFDDGSICAVMDAVQLLAEYSLRTGYKTQECIHSIQMGVKDIFRHLSEPVSGGFRFERNDCPAPSQEGYGQARLTNGLKFVLATVRSWQSIDPAAANSLEASFNSLRIDLSGISAV